MSKMKVDDFVEMLEEAGIAHDVLPGRGNDNVKTVSLGYGDDAAEFYFDASGELGDFEIVGIF